MQEQKAASLRTSVDIPRDRCPDLNPFTPSSGPAQPGAGLLKTAHSERRLDNAELQACPIGASSRSGSGDPSMENRGRRHSPHRRSEFTRSLPPVR
jgi:hypothetical protein